MSPYRREKLSLERTISRAQEMIRIRKLLKLPTDFLERKLASLQMQLVYHLAGKPLSEVLSSG